MRSDNGRESSPWLWAALGVCLQLTAYAMLRAGKTVGYEHWPHSGISGYRGVLLSCVMLAHVMAIYLYRAELLQFLRDHEVPRWRVAAALLFTASIAVSPSRDPRFYLLELCIGGAVAVMAAISSVLFVVRVGAGGGRLSRWLDAPDGSQAMVPILGIAAAVVLVTFGLAAFVYEFTPHLPDEIVYLLQAKYFASGQLTLPAPPAPEAFDIDLMFARGGRWYSPVPPGWAAILSLGVRAGVPWLVNPLLSGVTVVLVYLLVRRLTHERTARLAAVLLALSPWFLFLGMSLMTHASSSAITLAAALGIAVAKDRSVAWPAALAGVGVGMVSLIRPLEGLAVALVLGVWSLSARTRYWRLAPSAALTLSTIAVGSLTRVYNTAMTGNASVFPIMQYADSLYAPGANDLGFGANRGLGWGGLDPWPGHGAKDVALNSLLNVVAVQRELFGWLAGSLGVILLVLVARRARRLDWYALATVVFVAALHGLYWFSGGPDFGARYWYPALVPLILLTARGAELLAPSEVRRRRYAVGLVALTALSSPLFVAWRSVDKYHHYRGMGASFARFADTTDLSAGLVLIRGKRHPDYHEASLGNPLDFSARVPLMAWDRTATIRQAAIRAFPTRPVFIVDGPSVTGGGYRLVAGPLPPGSYAAELGSSETLPQLAPSAQRAP